MLAGFLKLFSLDDIQQVGTEPVVEQDVGSAEQPRQALGSPATAHQCRFHDARIPSPTADYKPHPLFDAVQDLRKCPTSFGRRDPL